MTANRRSGPHTAGTLTRDQTPLLHGTPCTDACLAWEWCLFVIVAISRDSLSSQVQVLCQDMDKFLVALFVILALSPAVWAKTTYLQITCEQDLSKLARLEDCEKAIAHLYSHPITQECGAWQADHETTMHIDATCRL